MGKINLLSEELCNRIAAGEVIDRPYSVVKELVENSIDAGATEIEVYIERGGKDMIKVIDNGCGIERDDMREAFFPHATSKITTLEDIEHIHTLGFRGEALATISAVAEVELISSTDGVEANRVFCDGEFIGKVEPAASAPKGTQICVSKLFFNTPVRLKFMNSDKKEETDISTYMNRYVLSHPDISFKYYVNGKLSMQSYGGGIEESITQVYGPGYLPNCFKISAERNNIKVSGFIGNQNFFKSNKTYQTIFLNGRYISNQIITSAISSAYAPYAMKRQFPFYVLFINVPDEMVDINVHPNKQDVRFVDNQLIYGTVYKIISSILDGSAKAVEYVVEDKETAAKQEQLFAKSVTIEEKIYDKDFNDVAGIDKYAKPEKQRETLKYNTEDLLIFEDYPAPQERNFQKVKTTLRDYFAYGDEIEPAVFEVCSGIPRPPKKISQDEVFAQVRQQRLEFEECKYRGTLFNTYIIYEMKNDVYMIDQHAAHERLIYDSLIKKLEERQVNRQGMVVPFIFIVTPEEKQFIEDNVQVLWEIGFRVEPFGLNSFRVNEVPADLPDLNLDEFFKELLPSVQELKKIQLADIVKDKIAQTACKHAVKGGDTLTEQERDELFSKLKNNLSLKCPHGRPVCVKLSKTELEKMFKRKV